MTVIRLWHNSILLHFFFHFSNMISEYSVTDEKIIFHSHEINIFIVCVACLLCVCVCMYGRFSIPSVENNYNIIVEGVFTLRYVVATHKLLSKALQHFARLYSYFIFCFFSRLSSNMLAFAAWVFFSRNPINIHIMVERSARAFNMPNLKIVSE